MMTKTSLQPISNFIVLIQFHLICRMLVKFSGVVSEREIKRKKKNKNGKSEDYSKADLKERVLFFITIFRLAIPAFFRFTDVTELM